MNVWEAKFSQSQVAAATGVQRNRMLMWFKNGHIRYAEGDGDEALGAGLPHRVSARTAMRIAIMGALSAFVDVGSTEAAVLKFMDMGCGPTPEGRPVRSPGDVFDRGETVLFVFADGSADVVCIEASTMAHSLPGFRTGACAAFLPLNELHAAVLRRLESMHAIPDALSCRKTGSVRSKVDA